MIGLFRCFALFLNLIRCFPHLILLHTHSNRKMIRSDVKVWLEILHSFPVRSIYKSQTLGLLYLLSFFPEYRNLFYKRIGYAGYLLNIICPKRSGLIINSGPIGEGFFIRHGLATIVGAKKIGNHCQVNQNVTITEGVTLGNHVKVLTGAVILGRVTIGDFATIGANTTIMHNVPDHVTVISPRPKSIQWRKEKTSEAG